MSDTAVSPLPDVLNLDQVTALLRVNERTVLMLLHKPGSGLWGFKAGQQWRIHRHVLLSFVGIGPGDPQDVKVLTTEEVAARLQVHHATVCRWLLDKNTALEAFKVGRVWRIHEHIFNAYIAISPEARHEETPRDMHQQFSADMDNSGAPTSAEFVGSLEVHV